MKWANILRNRLLGVPVFGIPVALTLMALPVSDIEFMDKANRLHEIWHGFRPTTPHPARQMSAPPTQQSVCAEDSTYGQSALSSTQSPSSWSFTPRPAQWLYNWARRAGCPCRALETANPAFSFDGPSTGNFLNEVLLSETAGVQHPTNQDWVRANYNTLLDLAGYAKATSMSPGRLRRTAGTLDRQTATTTARAFRLATLDRLHVGSAPAALRTVSARWRATVQHTATS